MPKIGYIVFYGPWLSKVLKIIHFNIIIIINGMLQLGLRIDAVRNKKIAISSAES